MNPDDAPFTIYPAIDLRQGQVVRLSEGDPARQTVYSANPLETADRFFRAGAAWLHVVNLDGAFDDPLSAKANLTVLAGLCRAAAGWGAKVQFGGGLRSEEAIRRAFDLGIERAVLGTAVVEQPELLPKVLAGWGAERIAAGLDARDGLLRVRGWQGETGLRALDVAGRLAGLGLKHLVFTDIARDGLQGGLNLASTLELARATGLCVIASGGVSGLEDVEAARAAGLAGVIVGRALYEGSVRLDQLFPAQP